MVKMKKRLTTLCLCLFMAMAAYIPVLAEEQTVFDQAVLFKEEEIKNLEDKVQELEEKSGWEIFIATNSIHTGKTAQAYADEFFDERTSAETSGLIFLIDMYTRELYLSTAGEAVAYFNDRRIENILDEGYYYITDGAYAEGVEAMLDEAGHYYRRGILDNQKIYDTETGEVAYYRKITIGEFFVSLAAGMGVALLIFLGVTGKYRLKFVTYKYNYKKNGKLDVTYENDQFINQIVTNRVIPRNIDYGGRGKGGRSSTHTSSSGRSHGGGGRRF